MDRNPSGSASMRAPCRFYNTSRGCNKGDSCPFPHEAAPAGISSVTNSGSRASAGGACSYGRGVRGGGFSPGQGSSTSADYGLFTRLLQDLGSTLDLQLPAVTVQRWVQLALQRCDRGDTQQVLQNIRRSDGSNLLSAVALQLSLPEIGQSCSQLLGVVIPVLKLLTKDTIRSDPVHSNPVLATLHHSLQQADLAKVLQHLNELPAAAAPDYFKQQTRLRGSMAMPCQPSDWLDVLQPIAIYLLEVTQRFSATFRHQPDMLTAAKTLVDVLASALQRHLPADSAAARSKTADWRRLLSSVALLQRQLNAHQDASKVIEQLQAMRAQYDAQQKQQNAAAAGPAGGPGELNPGGPRHDNDKVNHLDISVAPTRDEVLCNKPPFLPYNRPGSLPHASHDPDRAHRELHFRLLRHDVVGPVSDAANAFRQFGGVAGLKSIKNQTPGFSTRLHLKSGHDYQDLYVFRNVAILGLTSTFSGGIAYKIEFDDAPQLAAASPARRRDWWAQTKQLQHGSLAALWWDADATSGSSSSSSTAGPLPNIMFATVCERDEKLLAQAGEPRKRPQLGLRMCGAAVTTELMAAVLGRQRLGGKKEVVLLPAAGGFFAYAPILRALQATHPLPLARYILQGGAAFSGVASFGSADAPVLLRGELVGGGMQAGGGINTRQVEVPAYAAGPECCYDLSSVIRPEKLKDLSSLDIQKLQRVCINSSGGVPIELLLRATTFDSSQAAALAACITKELAVIQGPPGCGKTYIGVQLVRILLANTCTSTTAPVSKKEATLSSIPPSLQPVIGPILVLCYTNHALDSFLLDILHAGITEGIVRVGRRSSCAELELYNLRNQEGAQARGVEFGRCRSGVENLKKQVNELLERLKASRTARRLRWDDVQQWLQRQHPELLEAFSLRAALMEHAAFLQAASAQQDTTGEFIPVNSKRSRRPRQQAHEGGITTGSATGCSLTDWVWGADVLQDWLHSSPVQDWQRSQWIWEKAQQWEEEADWGLSRTRGESQPDDSTAAAALAGSGTSSAADAAAAAQGNSRGTDAYASNPFAALQGLEDLSPEDGESSITKPGHGTSADAANAKNSQKTGKPAMFSSMKQAAADTGTGGNAAALPPADRGFTNTSSGGAKGFGEWMLFPPLAYQADPLAPASADSSAAETGTAADLGDGDEWEMAEHSESDTDTAAEDEKNAATETEKAATASPGVHDIPSGQQQTQQANTTHHHCNSRANSTDGSSLQRQRATAASKKVQPAALHHQDEPDVVEAAVPADVQELESLDRPIHALLELDDITMMSRSERAKLYHHWLNTLANGWGTEISELVQELEQEQQTLKKLCDFASLQVLRNARIIGVTTTGLANQQGMLQALQPKVVIVEEAAEVLEAHIITSLTPTVEHLVLIGDHLQLPPKVEVYELQKESGRGYNLNMSMFERLVESKAVQHDTLQQQRRMRPEIAELIRGPLYPQLHDHPAVTAYPHVKGMVKDVFFWDHNHKEGGTDASKSRFNEHEVKACVGLARYLLQQGYGGREQPDVCILTPYVGQLLRLRQAVAAVSSFKVVMSERDQADLTHVITDASMTDSTFDLNSSTDANTNDSSSSDIGAGPDGQAAATGSALAAGLRPPAGLLAGAGSKVVTLGSSLRLATIDNFQGEEARIIILSLVRNPREDGGSIGFLAVNNRINVLLSRAKEGMFLVGSSSALYAAAEKAAAAGRDCMWASVLDHLNANNALGPSLQVCCQRHGNVTDISHPDEFSQLVGDGGCQQACGLKLPCGHTCPRRCHADDSLHSQTKCFKPCGKLCTRGRHPCELLCYEPCTRCTALEEQVLLPCGHTARDVPCHKAAEPEKIPCTQLVTVTVPACGHQLVVPCSQYEAFLKGTAPCTQLVQITLPACSHSMTLPCSKAAAALLDPTQCSSTCGGLLPGCEHICSSSCGKCIKVRLQPVQGTGTGTAAAAAAVDTSATGNGLIELFLQQLKDSQLLMVWIEWCADTCISGAAAVQQEQLSQRWQRFMKDKIAAAIGTTQCAVLGLPVSTSSSSSNIGPAGDTAGEGGWESYISSCRQSQGTKSHEELLAAEWQAWLLQNNPCSTPSSSSGSGGSRLQSIHMACNKPCQKPLACGHSCQSTCHQGSSCAPCQQPCAIACEHARCHQKCADPCAPCAEPCGWWCEHMGECLLPCGVPCDRKPCNFRCSKALPCGHRCPGLCGETCLPKKFCVHPACLAKASQAVKDTVVDMLLFKSFKELTDAEVTADPLILLPCGHLFSASTLDGHMGMADAYQRTNEAPGAGSSSGSDLEVWGAPLNRRDFPPPKTCPDCRHVISGVRRYGRVVLHSQLGMTQRKHAEAIRARLKGSFDMLKRMQDHQLSPSAPWRDKVTADAANTLINKKKPLVAGLLKDLESGARGAWNLGIGFNQLVASAQRTPKQYVAEMRKAALMTAYHQGQLSYVDGCARWAALEAFSGKPDLQLAFKAIQGHAEAMHLCLSLITRQLEACAAGLESLACAGVLGFGNDEDQGTGLRPAVGVEGGLGRRQVKGWTGWLAQQKRDLEGQVHRLVATSTQVFEGAESNLNWAISAAAADACYTDSYRLSHCLMLLCIQRASQLQPLKQTTLARLLSRHATVASATHPSPEGVHQRRLRDMQEQLLKQAEQSGKAAVQLYAQQKQRLLAEAGTDLEEQLAVLSLQDRTVQKVESLLGNMAEIRAELAGEVDAAEVAAVLNALMQAEGRYYSNFGLASFMAGHLYECPNGHLFVIGECGGAMQASRCDRCGARIGGINHQLDARNRHANSALVGAVVEAAAGGMNSRV